MTVPLAAEAPGLAKPILFVEPRFLWIFAVIWAVHWALRWNGARKLWLLVASHAFYAAFFIGDPGAFFPKLFAGSFGELPVGWWFPGLLWLSTLMDYRVGLGIAEAQSPPRRRAWLLLSVAVNLGVLGFFKYYGFFEQNVRAVFGWLGLTPAWEPLRIFLPYGISFYTFQSLSYSIEVYRGRLPAERSFLNLAFFIAFFPQLIAGPIVRAMTFLPQTRAPRRLAAVDARGVASLFLVGFVKKACVADGLAFAVDAYFHAPQQYDAWSAWAAMLCYAAQIYCDFSGYTDMAVAVARGLGYELCPNFEFPYLSANVGEFWRRWHISLSTWLRDYLYIPLGGSRGSTLATWRNLMVTMLLGGLWHGAAWTFVAWGGLHGAALVVHRQWARLRGAAGQRPLRFLTVPLTFAFVVLAWVPFRAGDVYVDADSGKPLLALADGFHREHGWRPRFPIASLERDPASGNWHAAGRPERVRVVHVSGGFGTTASVWRSMLGGGGGSRRVAEPSLLLVLALLAAVHAANRLRWWKALEGALPGWSYAGLLGAGWALALFAKTVSYRPFIYFQF